jgi:hypothetical protein
MKKQRNEEIECLSSFDKKPWRAGDVAQVVQHLSSKYKSLSSNSTTTKKKKKKRKKEK